MSLDYTEPDIKLELSLRRKTEEYFIRGQIIAICNVRISIAEKDEEVRRMEAFYSEVVRDGCNRLVKRLGPDAPSIFDADPKLSLIFNRFGFALRTFVYDLSY
jgi:hypothetical protein